MADDPLLETDEPFAPHPSSTPTPESEGGSDWLLQPDKPFAEPVGPQYFTPEPSWNRRDIALGLQVGTRTGVFAPALELGSRLAASPENQRYLSDLAQQQREAAEETRQGMTPGAEKTWPVWGAEFAPPAVAMAIPAIAAGPAGWGTELGATLVGSGVSGALAAGQRLSDVKETIDKTPTEDLMKDPEFAADINNGATEGTARFNLMQRHQSAGRDIATFGMGAVAGGIGPWALAAGGVDPLKVLNPSESRLISLALGGGEGATILGGQMTGQAYLTQQQAHEAGAGPAPTLGSVTAGQGPTLAVGTVFGAAGAAMHAHPGIDKGPPRAPSKTAPDVGPVAGVSGGGHGSPTDYAKPKVSAPGRAPPEEGGGITDRAAAPVDALANQAGAPPPQEPTEPVSPLGDADIAAAAVAAARPEGETTPPMGPARTPESVTPQAQPVNTTQVAENIPPRVEPVQEAPGRPPAGIEAPPVAPPQPPPERPPAAAPVAPTPAPEQVMREPDATLREQHAALLDRDNPREAMVYPPGVQPIDIVGRDKYRFGAQDLQDGRVIQYDRNGPSKFTKDKIAYLDKENKLNEALQMGPVTKDEAVQRIAQGETPIATVERTPEGTEVKAALGTDQTAPMQREAFEQTKAPENTVQHEAPQDTVADRFAKVRQENIEKAQAQAEKAPVVPTGRTVRNISPEEQAAAAHVAVIEAERARTVEEELKAKQAAKVESDSRTKKEKADIKRTNDLARNIAGGYTDRKLDPNSVYERAKGMVDKAKQAKIEIPSDFREGHPYTPDVLRLREAADLVRKDKPLKDELARYIVMENLLDRGQHEDAYAVRRAEGAASLGGVEGKEVVDTGGHEEEVTPESERPYEAEAEAEGAEVYKGEETPQEKAKREAREAAAKTAEEEAQRWEAKLAERKEKAAQPAGFQVATKRKFAMSERPKVNVGEALKAKTKPEVMRQEIPETLGEKLKRIRAEMEARAKELGEAEAKPTETPKAITTSHDNGTDVEVTAQREEDVHNILKNVDYSKFDKDLQPVWRKVIDRMDQVVGHLPVYWVSHADMKRTGTASYGAFMWRHDHILLNSERVHPDGLQATQIHEVLHAAVDAMYRHDPEFGKLLDQLRDEAVSQWMEKLDPAYGFTEAEKNMLKSGSEFLAELMSNPRIQELFKKVKISSDLARKLDIPRWRLASAWHGFLSAIGKAFGLTPREVGVIEAGLRLTEVGTIAREGGRDAGLEYSGRLVKAGRGELGPLDKIAAFKVKRDLGVLGEPPPPVAYQRILTNPDEAGKGQQASLRGVGSTIGKLIDTGGEHISDKFFTKGLGLMPSDAIRIRWEPLFGPKGESNPFLRAQEGFEKIGSRMRTIMKPSDPMFKEIQMLGYRDPEKLQALDELLHDASEASFHPGQKIGEGLNSHLTGRPDPSNTNLNDWMAHANREWLVGRYKALGDQRDLFDRTIEFMTDLGKKEVNATRVNMVNAIADNYRKNEDFQDILSKARKKAPLAPNMLSESEREELGRYAALDKVIRGAALNDTDKVWDGGTRTEKEKFATGKEADPNIKALLAYDAMDRKPGPYIPSSRFGDYVVRATHKFDIPAGGERDANNPNDVIFADRKQAFKFMSDLKRGTGLSSRASIQYYFEHPDGTREYVEDKSPRQGPPGAGNITPESGVRIRVQTKHMELAGSKVEANRRRAALLNDPTVDPDSVSQVELTRNNRSIDYGLNQPTVRAMTDAINGLTHLDADTRQAMKDNMQHVMIAQQQGARLSKNLLRRNNVRGASDDLLRTLDQRRIAASAFIAKSEIMPEVNRAMDDMRDRLNANQTPDSFKMSAIIKEMETRIFGLGKDGYTGRQVSPMLARLNNVAFMQYLISPAHVMLHLSHPMLTSIPTMASKQNRNLFEAYRRTLKTYGDMGGLSEVAKGVKGGFRVGAKDYTPTDFVDDIKNTLKSKGATRDELDAIDKALETGHLHNTGYDFTEAYRGLNKVDRGLAMARDFSSEITSSADAINRIGTFLTEYRWSRDEGLSHFDAIRAAKDTLSETQGLFSATNRARYLQNPVIRSFMQFRQFPMLIYNMLWKHAYNFFKGETPEAKWQAAKALTGMIGTGMAMTGLGGGIPEPIRLGVTGLNALGLTDSWQEEEDKARRWVADNWSPQLAGLLMDGLGGEAGVDIHHRGGFNSLLFQFDPKSTSPQDMQDWVYNWMGGTPAGVAMDWYTAGQDLRQGDLEGAFEHGFPSKEVADLAKAYRMGTEGKKTPSGKQVIPPLGLGGMLAYGVGFTPESVARANTAQAVLNARQREAQTAHQAISKEYQEGNKGKAILEMRQWNATHPERPMKLTDLTKGPKATIFGQSVTPANQQYLKEYQRAYLQ